MRSSIPNEKTTLTCKNINFMQLTEKSIRQREKETEQIQYSGSKKGKKQLHRALDRRRRGGALADLTSRAFLSRLHYFDSAGAAPRRAKLSARAAPSALVFISICRRTIELLPLFALFLFFCARAPAPEQLQRKKSRAPLFSLACLVDLLFAECLCSRWDQLHGWLFWNCGEFNRVKGCIWEFGYMFSRIFQWFDISLLVNNR